jgi:hypothetical protein
MFRTMNPVVVLLLFLLLPACQTARPEKELQPVVADSSSGVPDPAPSRIPVPVQPPAVKPNLTFVGAAFDSIHHIDTIRYKAFLFVGTAIPEPGKESLVEPGQRLIAEPLYVVSADGTVDLSNPRNAKLYSLYGKSPRESFLGKVTMIPGRGWFIVDVE